MRALLAALLLFLVQTAAFTAAAAPVRDPMDAEEVTKLRARHPHAAELLEKGEALAMAGALDQAEELFRQSEQEDPDCSVTFRRDCEALTVLGQRQAAIQACSHGLSMLHTNPNVLALVHAIIAGPAAPTTDQVLQALTFTAIEQYKAPGAPTPTAAVCEIAARIGDEAMLQNCVEQLGRVAPDHPARRRALSLLESRCPPWRFALGWLSIVAATLITLGHAIARRRRVATVAAAAAAFVGIGLWTGSASAGPSETPSSGWLSQWPVDENNPASSIPSEKARNQDPLQFGYWIQDVALWAEHKSAKGDHAGAVKFYEVLAQVAPDRAVAFVKLCKEYEAMGDTDKAIASCGDALLRDGTVVKDYEHFVRLVVNKPGRLSPKEIAALGAVIEHMKIDPAARPFVDELECEVGTRTNNVAQLRECTARLAARAPEGPATISYEWALAVQENDFSRADELVERAKAAGVPPANLEQMTKVTAAHARSRALRAALVLVTVLLLGAAVWLIVRMILQHRAAKQVPAGGDEAAEAAASALPPAGASG
jgi:tetratricopeptide (TPR) repeat protein